MQRTRIILALLLTLIALACDARGDSLRPYVAPPPLDAFTLDDLLSRYTTLTLDEWLKVEVALDRYVERDAAEIEPAALAFLDEYHGQNWLNWPVLKPMPRMQQRQQLYDASHALEHELFDAIRAALPDKAEAIERAERHRRRPPYEGVMGLWFAHPWNLTKIVDGLCLPEEERTAIDPALDAWERGFDERSTRHRAALRAAYERHAAWLETIGVDLADIGRDDAAWLAKSWEQWKADTSELRAISREMLRAQREAVDAIAAHLSDDEAAELRRRERRFSYEISSPLEWHGSWDLAQAALHSKSISAEQRDAALTILRDARERDEKMVAEIIALTERESLQTWPFFGSGQWSPLDQWSFAVERRRLDKARRDFDADVTAKLSAVVGQHPAQQETVETEPALRPAHLRYEKERRPPQWGQRPRAQVFSEHPDESRLWIDAGAMTEADATALGRWIGLSETAQLAWLALTTAAREEYRQKSASFGIRARGAWSLGPNGYVYDDAQNRRVADASAALREWAIEREDRLFESAATLVDDDRAARRLAIVFAARRVALAAVPIRILRGQRVVDDDATNVLALALGLAALGGADVPPDAERTLALAAPLIAEAALRRGLRAAPAAVASLYDYEQFVWRRDVNALEKRARADRARAEWWSADADDRAAFVELQASLIDALSQQAAQPFARELREAWDAVAYQSVLGTMPPAQQALHAALRTATDNRAAVEEIAARYAARDDPVVEELRRAADDFAAQAKPNDERLIAFFRSMDALHRRREDASQRAVIELRLADEAAKR